jgi:hypothetical protein
MKITPLPAALAAVVATVSLLAAQPPAGLADSDWSGIRAAHERQRHAIVANPDGTHQTRNPGQAWVTRFDARGFTVTPDAGGWSWGLELTEHADVTEVRTDGGKISFLRGHGLTEWFVNDSRGLEQGWTLENRPEHAAGTGPLRLELAVRGSLRPQIAPDGGSVAFVNEAGGATLTYGGLKAWDADGQHVPARFAAGADRTFGVVVDDAGARYPLTIDPIAQQAYLKASNSGYGDKFGQSVAVSGDTVVIGAIGEGAVYVFVRSGTIWNQQAYLTASNTGLGDYFGHSVSISGNTLVVGAYGEDSNSTGINGNQADNSATNSGAVYVFVRSGTTWGQQAYLKASNTGPGDSFGRSVALSQNTVVIGARNEDSNATGVDGNQADNSAVDSGAAYVFVRSGTVWTQQAYLKASNSGASDLFGGAIEMDGDTLVVGASGEASNATGVNGNQADNSAAGAGAGYVFVRNGTTWTQQSYLKASNAATNDAFGVSLGVSGDTVVIGATLEASSATGVNGNQADNSAPSSGAAYVFVRTESTWSQQAYLKASNSGGGDYFARAVAIVGDTILCGAFQEDSNATGINGNHADNSALNSGAAYVFGRSGPDWSQQAYLKASNTQPGDNFGWSVALSQNTVVIGALNEDSLSSGVNGEQWSDYAGPDFNSGAAYVFLSIFATPVTAADFITRGRILLAEGTNPGLMAAGADFSAALALAPANEEARFLHAFTSLLLLQTEPAFDQVLSDIGASRADLDSPIDLPQDAAGHPIFKPGARTKIGIDWVTGQLLPRLAAVRNDLSAITSDTFRTSLNDLETDGGGDVLVDKGDVLVIKAFTHGLEMLFNLLFTYDLDVPLEAMVTLEKNSQLDAQQVLATTSALLKFAASDRRPQFAAALRAMQLDYATASDFIRSQRGDPMGLLTEGLSTDPEQEVEIRDGLASAVASLNGVVTYQDTRVNLSRLMVTKRPLRDWLPEFRGEDAVSGTVPDPTFDGILPDLTGAEVTDRIYQIGALWGMSQYAEEFGDYLRFMTGTDDPSGDSDGDGRNNFAEWLALSDPITPDTVWQDFTRNVIAPGKNEVRLTFARRKDLRDWKVRVAVSDDLVSWDRTESQIEMVGAPVDNGDGFTETVTYRLKDAAALANRKFMRVEAAPK